MQSDTLAPAPLVVVRTNVEDMQLQISFQAVNWLVCILEKDGDTLTFREMYDKVT